MTEDLITWLRRTIEAERVDAQEDLDVSHAARRSGMSGPIWDDQEARARDRFARCEAESAILDLHDDTRKIRDRVAALFALRVVPTAAEARDYGDALRELAVLDIVVRFLASGRRHCGGYLPEWAPEGTSS
ncbi:hypothetical protein HS041_12225 [Planomonospora sp. ID67723]|uniref:hypothetical protein n=1 Tax=Planomonospora sp. ID67723 TaxID=2738134 RepID=UPI0018C37944|nr:hypothetical protein [Planomonospora sp. ID67723]MBG0828535.1 hypothetical protein [Planomonospora sp. ID67723]